MICRVFRCRSPTLTSSRREARQPSQICCRPRRTHPAWSLNSPSRGICSVRSASRGWMNTLRMAEAAAPAAAPNSNAANRLPAAKGSRRFRRVTESDATPHHANVRGPNGGGGLLDLGGLAPFDVLAIGICQHVALPVQLDQLRLRSANYCQPFLRDLLLNIKLGDLLLQRILLDAEAEDHVGYETHGGIAHFALGPRYLLIRRLHGLANGGDLLVHFANGGARGGIEAGETVTVSLQASSADYGRHRWRRRRSVDKSRRPSP